MIHFASAQNVFFYAGIGTLWAVRPMHTSIPCHHINGEGCKHRKVETHFHLTWYPTPGV